MNDQLDSIAPVTKWRRRVLQVAEIPAAVRAAVEQLKTGRPRPVEIELPPETMEDEGEVELLDPVRHVRPAATADDVDRAAELLSAAEAPSSTRAGESISRARTRCWPRWPNTCRRG